MTRIEEVKARYEAATDGPWTYAWIQAEGVVIQSGIDSVDLTSIPRPQEPYFYVCRDAYGEPNGQFIAHSREDIPWLVKMVERQAVLSREMFGLIDETLWPLGVKKWVEKTQALLKELEAKP